MGFVEEDIKWPRKHAEAWKMLGNTWPIHVISKLLKQAIGVIDGDVENRSNWLGHVDWEKTEYARRIRGR